MFSLALRPYFGGDCNKEFSCHRIYHITLLSYITSGGNAVIPPTGFLPRHNLTSLPQNPHALKYLILGLLLAIDP